MDSKVSELPQKILTIVKDLRANKPALNLPPGASEAERNYAYTSLAAQQVAFAGRIADALEGMYAAQVLIVRQRFDRGVPWLAFWIVVVFALISIAVLAFTLGMQPKP